MQLSRREFLKAAAAIGLTAAEFSKIQQAVAGNGDPPVIWLQGQVVPAARYHSSTVSIMPPSIVFCSTQSALNTTPV